MSDRIENLRALVETHEKCKATHVESVPIRETFNGQLVWEGVVEVFAITNHPAIPRCYAWNYVKGRETQFVTVLETPPVKDALSAVRTWLASLGQASRV
jgi:hypothetical protein